MNIYGRVIIGLLAIGLCLAVARADEKRFTYTYEPELLPKGGMEFEQWITLRTQKTAGGEVQQDNYNLWEIREELEYGVTDNYSLSMYLNFAAESFRDVSQHPPVNHSKFDFAGVSLENRYLVLNPANHVVGLTLYLEPRFSGDQAEIEAKIILSHRYGDWN
jgi:hypothetical protein